MSRKQEHPILTYVSETHWAMRRETLDQLVGVVGRHVSEIRLPADQVEEIVAPRQAKARRQEAEGLYERQGTLAVIPVSGVIAKYSRMVNGSSQPRGTSVELLTEQLDAAMADDGVRSIFLHIESPGGFLAGTPDLADRIYEARLRKTVYAFADDLAASGAYWLGSQADKFWANQSAQVGSIGVYLLLVDSSRWAEDQGLAFHIIRSGEHKGVGEFGVAITAANLEALQAENDRFYQLFLDAVLRGRLEAGLDREALLAIADGRTFVGREAADLKLIDGVKTLSQALAAARRQTQRQANETSAARRPDELGPEAGAETTDQLEEETIMADSKDTKPAALTSEDLQKARQEATEAERNRCAAVARVLAAYPDLIAQAQADGSCGEKEAMSLLVPALQGKVAGLQAELADANARLAAIAKGGQKAVAVEPSDDDLKLVEAAKAGEAHPADDGRPETYQKAVDAAVKAGRRPSEAHRDAAVNFPKSHKAWTEAGR